MKVRFCGLSMWQMDLSSGSRVPSFFVLKQKKDIPANSFRNCKRWCLYRRRRDLNDPPHQQSLLAITQSRPYRTVTKGAVTAALRSFPWEKRFLFCFSHLQHGPRVPFFRFKTKKDINLSWCLHRRRRDLNPRAALTTYTLSRGTSSASWVLLQVAYCKKQYTIILSICQTFFSQNRNFFINRAGSERTGSKKHRQIILLFPVFPDRPCKDAVLRGFLRCHLPAGCFPGTRSAF